MDPIPPTYTSVNETGCCAVPNTSAWDATTVTFDEKPFIRGYTRSILHVPLNMGSVMGRLEATAVNAQARPDPTNVMILSRELSPWRAEHLYAVTSPVLGADNEALSGTYASLVFNGPYSHLPQWRRAMTHYAAELGAVVETTYFFYTTCPKCAKHYGNNFVIGLARIR